MNRRTWGAVEKHIQLGRGSGHLDCYLPWLFLHRKNASPTSNQIVKSLPGYKRASHFFARVEYYFALLCLWLGALDVREQFPLWPMEHPHPLTGSGPVWRAPRARGLWAIAEQAAIRHGTEVGSNRVPYVATMDIMVTAGNLSRKKLAGISLKPHDLVTAAEPTDRMIERQELERRYMVEIGSHHVIADSSMLSLTLRANLDACARNFNAERLEDNRHQDLLGVLCDASLALELEHALRLSARAIDLPYAEAMPLVMSAIWHREIDVDITEPIRPDFPLTFGGHRTASAFREDLFGYSDAA